MTSTNGSDSSAVVTSPLIPEVPVTVDSQGRVRVSKEQRRVILAEFERSRMPAAQFARRAGLKYSTLAGWLQRYRQTKSPGRERAVRLLEAVVEQHGGGTQPALATLQFPGGARMEISNLQQAVLAADLLRALAKSC
jgi:transposase-like protein